MSSRAVRAQEEAPRMLPPIGRSPAASEPLETISHDIARMVDHAAIADAWDRYRGGESGAFARGLYIGRGAQTFEEIRRRYRADADFRVTVDRYIQEFERLLADVGRDDRDDTLTRTYLTSETGKVYTMLAHAAGRLEFKPALRLWPRLKDCQSACKPGFVWRAEARVTAIPLGRPLPAVSSNLPGRGSGDGPAVLLRGRLRPYSVLLPVGLAMPRLLPDARCALTAPFHPYLPANRRAVSFLWRYPWGRPRRTLSGTVSPWSPDFPPQKRRPSGRLARAGIGAWRRCRQPKRIIGAKGAVCRAAHRDPDKILRDFCTI